MNGVPQRRFTNVIRAMLPALALSACATMHRPAVSERVARDAAIAEIPGARFWGDSPVPAGSAVPPSGKAVSILALSGGSDEGAFGAGFLNGWTRSGRRPTFDIVTGVSTGALIAPLAFLGSDYDARLTRAFTTVNRKDIFSVRFPPSIPFSTSVAKTKPLQRLIARSYDDATIDAIGAQHLRGRRLYVGTANLDAQRTVIWDLGAIASSKSARRHALFRAVLLASSSIPLMFPPVFIDADTDGRPVRELHVDGGTVAGMLATPPALDAHSPGGPGSRLFLLVNSRLGGDYQMVKASLTGITKRALTLAIQSALRERTRGAYDWSRREGVGFHLSYIAPDFGPDDAPIFDPAYMRRLYDYGWDKGARAAWDDRPPFGDKAERKAIGKPLTELARLERPAR